MYTVLDSTFKVGLLDGVLGRATSVPTGRGVLHGRTKYGEVMRFGLTKIPTRIHNILRTLCPALLLPFPFFISTWTSSPLPRIASNHCISCCPVSRLRNAPIPRSNVEFELRKPPNLTADTDCPILRTAALLALILDHGFAFTYGHYHLEGGGHDLRRLYIRGRKCLQECG